MKSIIDTNELEKTSDELVNEVVLPPITRRVVAFVIDAFISIFVAVCLFAFVSPYAASIFVNYEEVSNLYRQRLEDSGLYIETTTNLVELVTDIYTEDEKNNKHEEYYHALDKAITGFYTNPDFYTQFENEENINMSIESYIDSKNSSGYFLDSTKIYENDSDVTMIATKAKLKIFFESEFEKALNFLSLDNDCLDYARTITTTNILQIVFSVTISFSVFYLIVPICTKYRQTLGKKLMNIAIVSRNTGLLATKIQILIRFISFYLIEVLLSVFILALPLLISFTMLFFSKSRVALHDYFSATLCVDYREIPVFSTREELEMYYQKSKR